MGFLDRLRVNSFMKKFNQMMAKTSNNSNHASPERKKSSIYNEFVIKGEIGQIMNARNSSNHLENSPVVRKTN